MTPRRRRLPSRIQAVTESQAMAWVKVLMPILTILLSGFAVRQSKQAKDDTQEVANSMAVVVQDQSDNAADNVRDHDRIVRLEAEVAKLKGRHFRVASRPETLSDSPQAKDRPGLAQAILSIAAAPFRLLGRLIQGG